MITLSSILVVGKQAVQQSFPLQGGGGGAALRCQRPLPFQSAWAWSTLYIGELSYFSPLQKPYKNCKSKLSGDSNQMLGQNILLWCGSIPLGARPTNVTTIRIIVSGMFL